MTTSSTDKLAILQQMSDNPHDYDIGHWWNAVDLAIEEIERLRQQVAQRGARMQVIVNSLNDTWWDAFVEQHPEAADWFDADGVPR